jgi:DNA-binding response OmpR family regulator
MKDTILVVEDDNNVRELLEDILLASGYYVILASDAFHAFEILNSQLIPDLIISDIMMPGKTGTDFFFELREKYSYLNIPFIFLTAKSDDADCRDGMNLGADDYLKKPFKTKDLLRSIELRLIKKTRMGENLKLFSKSLAINIPHELRTPLVPIIGLSDLILEDYDNFTKEEINGFLTNIKSSGTKLKERINKLLIYQEIELLDLSFQYNLNKLPISAVCCIENIIDSIYEVANKFDRFPDLIVNLTKADLLITPEHLNLLVKELSENSFQFSKAGSVVEINGKVENNVYEFSFKDNGIGIHQNNIASFMTSMDKPEELFNPNYTGFGLFIVKKILKINRSHLKVSSVPDRGTMVSFSINLRNTYIS